MIAKGSAEKMESGVKIAICDDDKEAVKYHGDIVKDCLYSCGIGYEIATYTQSSNLLFDITDDHYENQ